MSEKTKNPADDSSPAWNSTWSRNMTHQNLGECTINMECLAIQARNADPTSIFVEHDGDIKEVSRAMISEPK
jgi:hypothetical protein